MNHSPDNSSDNDWDNGEIAWNEHDWQQYLRKNESEIARFTALYFKNIARPDRLDAVAHLMQWDRNDWVAGADEEESDDDDEASASAEGEYDTYTVHRHPVYMVTRALYQKLGDWVSTIMVAHPQSARLLYDFSRTLDAGQFDACMGFSSLDIGEYTLAICHLKRALGHVNASFERLGRVEFAMHPCVSTMLFDLRELWLRVIADCREENRRRTSGESD